MLKICMCALSMALGTRTKFQLEILIRSMISATQKFGDNILESSQKLVKQSQDSEHYMPQGERKEWITKLGLNYS